MTSNEIVDILNTLLVAEQASAVERLLESTVFVSWASADEYPVVKRIAREDEQHCEWLVDLIDAHRGAVRPRSGDVRSADMHFQELDYLLPRVIENEKAILRKYEVAAGRLGPAPDAAALINKIIARHRDHIETLTGFQQRATQSAAGSGGVTADEA